MAERRHEGTAGSSQPEAPSAVSVGPVRIDVVGVSVEKGRAVLSLSRKFSTPWARKFNEVYFGDDFRERLPDGWSHKGKHRVSGLGYDLYDRALGIVDVPSDEASFRQLMVAVRYALEQTNAAEPGEDPPVADSSLTPVLEEVFRIDQGGAASEPA